MAGKGIIKFDRDDLIKFFPNLDVDVFLERMSGIGLFKVLEDLDGDGYTLSDMTFFFTYYLILSDEDILLG